jgi:hypothetical protein
MKLNKVAAVALAFSLVMGSAASNALAQDQRTTDQVKGTVKVTAQSPSTFLDQRVKQICSMLGIKVKHTSKKVWVLTGKAKQIQNFQRMSGGLGLTLGSK